MGWIDEVETLPLAELAARLGYEPPRRGSLRPCPGCGADRRGSEDPRGPIGMVGQRWKCHRCDLAGGPIQLAQWTVFGERLEKGDERWRELRERLGVAAPEGWRAPYRPQPPPRRERPRPPPESIREVWASCRPVTADPEVADYLSQKRGLDPEAIARFDLARALPYRAPCPRWARFRGRAWSESGHRLLLRVVDETGHTRSLRARSILPDVPPGEKASAAAAGPGSAGELVYANGVARRMLAQRIPSEVLIVEGEMDWLTWAHRPAGECWGVLGIFSGSWSDAIGDAIPDGSTVTIRPHIGDPDGKGEKYADAIQESLRFRRIRVYRLRPPPPGPPSPDPQSSHPPSPEPPPVSDESPA